MLIWWYSDCLSKGFTCYILRILVILTSNIKAEYRHKKRNDYEQGKQTAKNSTQSILEHYSFRLKNGAPIFREK